MCFQMCLLYDPHALPMRVYQAELKSLQNVLQKTVVSSRKELLYENIKQTLKRYLEFQESTYA